jgi:hypothetical protein
VKRVPILTLIGWTNEHVVSQGVETVGLVLNAGLKTQRVLKAKVVRRDKALDLALLRVEGDEKFEALELGSDKDLAELTELIACGFPFGLSLAPKGEYPAINLNIRKVTSLRRNKEGELNGIQLDAAINQGNSGGPVLDRRGQVVGMVVSGIQGSGVNMAIPVCHIERFLAQPEINLALPVVKAENRHDTFEFTAKTITLIPTKEVIDLDLILGAGSASERRFPMKFAEGVYRAKAVPFPARKVVCRVDVKYEDSSVCGIAEDRAIRVGENEVKLSELRFLRLEPNPKAWLVDGKRVEGKLSGLETIPLRIGKQSMRSELAGALEVNIEVSEEESAISCGVVARKGGQEVGRWSGPLQVEGVSRPNARAEWTLDVKK